MASSVASSICLLIMQESAEPLATDNWQLLSLFCFSNERVDAQYAGAS